jgi:signal transduction histidine kinase
MPSNRRHTKDAPQQQARSGARRAQDANKAAEAWRNFCHDINGPLTSILMSCDLLLQENFPPAVRERLETIVSDALRIDQHLRSFRKG